MQVRLQKFLAEAGLGSRRRCETLIRAGKIAVNGRAVTALGTKVDPAVDQVALGRCRLEQERKVYLVLNKPVGVLCTNRDTHGRPRAIDLLPRDLPRLYTVGRLDRDTEGLLFLTNDGTFGLRLAHPRYKMPKTYLVEVDGVLASAAISRLLKGVDSEGERLRAAKVFQVRPRGQTTELRLVLTEGRKRQIRRMMATVGHPVRRLVRLAVGTFQLGNLKPGQWRYLTDEEICKLANY
ncbi:rRNA pseudouridine synthase [bacterium]|nr:rRNA pseudouridine synthase [bacterium]